LGVSRRLTTDSFDVIAWSPMTAKGSTADPLALSHPQYDAVVVELVAALSAVIAQARPDWMSWDGSWRCPGGAGLARASVADAMRLAAVIVSGERLCDRTIAKAIADSNQMAAAGPSNRGDSASHARLTR